MFQLFLVYYESRIADDSRLYPGVVAALDALSARGDFFAVCTNKIERPARLLLEKLGVADRFAFICGQDTFGVAKPDPLPLLRTIEASRGDKARALMIGDFQDRHRHGAGGGRAGDRGGFWLYRPSGAGIQP